MARSDIEKKRSGFEMGGEGRKNKKNRPEPHVQDGIIAVVPPELPQPRCCSHSN